ncbi:MAG: STAS domain-containing protein [Candidatus Riflebacteria bacterium]|nr:STAS domain-containing protein [Candidatus Riflebacteria bacterium]
MEHSKIYLENQTVTVLLENNLTVEVVSQIRDELKKYFSSDVKKMIIDMEGCKMIDSHGIALLMAAANSMQSIDGKLVLRNQSAPVAEIFNTLQLSPKFFVENTPKGADHNSELS